MTQRCKQAFEWGALAGLALLTGLALGCHDIGPLPPRPRAAIRGDSATPGDAATFDDDSSTASASVSAGTPDAGPATAVAPIATCLPLSSSEVVPARDVVASADAQPKDVAVFTRDVFGLFKSTCGACHVESIRAGFQVKDLATFAMATSDRQQKILDKIRSDDPSYYMPPQGQPNAKPWAQRSPDDPVVELAHQLEAWFAAGSPPDLYYVHSASGGASSQSPYLLSADVASALTNIGSCLPSKEIVGRQAAEMDKLDAFFAAATELPQALDQTDLISFESETLARIGVISFAPAYPLFSDNAHKMRHIRVPRGQSLVFDKTSQEFTIPPNTRVYKTFLKKVIDQNGHERYRKIETRLIVARPDGPDAADGSHDTHALFGSYAWNDDESQATLVMDPLRNGKPFRDRLLTYITDEGKAAQVLAGNPYNKVTALQEAGATRNYAIPGSDRCIQCHMGSHNHSFLLGLTPLQIARRKPAEGGVYEDASADEQAQLQRLIDYKLITGVTALSDVLPLEASQGDRAPRNDYELKAQGYMLGNCGHCHNPRGFPTTQNPVLKDLLRFFPDREGGVFQFPLTRTSPRIKRGVRQDIEIAYITPSLFDLEQEVLQGPTNYAPKWFESADRLSGYYLAAPWRSLIYRNVDTPFTFSEDYALYPHMPMNASGYDCRAPGIMGNWMVSIPARIATQSAQAQNTKNVGNEAEDPSPQLYVEVKPSDPDYAAALTAAKDRLNTYQKGGRANYDLLSKGWSITYQSPYRSSDYCPDTSDIVDPDVTPGKSDALTPQDHSSLPSLAKELEKDESARGKFAAQLDGVPDRAHWVVTDITDAPGDWYPRRSDWASVLVDQKLDGVDAVQKKVVGILQSVTLSDAFRSYAVAPVPFGIWQKKDGCDLSSVPKVSSLTGDARPAWFDRKVPPLASDDPVYVQSPGGMVFNEICINCHGPKFDSRGRQADTLMLMTGGDTRVANLRDGLLGPVMMPGANRQRVFGEHASAAVKADDWAARYVAWMGLGGTQRIIPLSILSLVGTTQVLGEVRPYPVTAESANMLSIAQTLCAQTLGRDTRPDFFDVDTGSIIYAGTSLSLIGDNGDAEQWTKLCGFENPPPVRIVSLFSSGFQIENLADITSGTSSWYKAATYPSSAPVGDQRGKIAKGIQPGNLAPWCVMAPADSATQSQLDEAQKKRSASQGPLPICPDTWLTAANKIDQAAFDSWSLRAAMNAGFSVFLYLDQLSRDALSGKAAPVAFDHCEQLKP